MEKLLIKGFVVLGLFIVTCFATERGSIVPLYIYPRTSNGGDAWGAFKNSFADHPIDVWAIVNVFNGPGATKDPNYVTAIQQLHSAGINTLGYVRTNYTKRSRGDVRRDVSQWKRWYKPKGIFLDEMASTEKKVTYYEDVTNYAKDNLNFQFVVGNAGTRVPVSYFSAVDTVVVYESPGLSAATVEQSACSYNNVDGKEALAILAYDVNQLDAALIRRAKECAGFIYITNDRGDNPWDTTPPYLSSLFQILSE